jgi:hypothetical protein
MYGINNNFQLGAVDLNLYINRSYAVTITERSNMQSDICGGIFLLRKRRLFVYLV